MPFNPLTRGVMSAAILKSRGIPNDKLFAPAALSALTTGGLLWLAIPLALANQQPATSNGTTATPGNDTVTDLFVLPNVVGGDKVSAQKLMSSVKQQVRFRPATVRCSDVVQAAGTVIAQDPEAGKVVAEGGIVLLYVQPDDEDTAA